MNGIVQIDSAQLKALLEADACVLVDVREVPEFEAARIKGARLLPLSRFSPDQLPDCGGKTLVLSCAAGARSQRAALAARAAGIIAVNYSGGMSGWLADGLPYESGPGGTVI